MTAAFALNAALSLPLHAQGQRRGHDPGWPCKGKVDPAYVQLAEATGGVVMLIKPAELEGTIAEMRASDRHEAVVFRAGGQFTEGAYEFDVPVDSTIESVYFLLSMQCLQSASVIRPSGEELRGEDGGVESHRFEAVRLFTVPAPDPGTWKVRLAGRGVLSVVVKARTDLRLSSVSFAAGNSPVKREAQQIEVSMSGEASGIGFQFISPSGTILAPLALAPEEEHESERTYKGKATPPNADFRVAMTGTDALGFRFQRVDERLNFTER